MDPFLVGGGCGCAKNRSEVYATEVVLLLLLLLLLLLPCAAAAVRGAIRNGATPMGKKTDCCSGVPRDSNCRSDKDRDSNEIPCGCSAVEDDRELEAATMFFLGDGDDDDEDSCNPRRKISNPVNEVDSIVLESWSTSYSTGTVDPRPFWLYEFVAAVLL